MSAAPALLQAHELLLDQLGHPQSHIGAAPGFRGAAPEEATMKLGWFHLMPYRWLPDDFRERYHSVWVDLPNALYDPRRGHQLYNEYLDMLEYADQMGFDAIGVNEHHQNAYGMMPSPNLMAAALTRRTANAMLVVLGNSIALYNPPTRVAEEFAMLDVMSGGRLVAGFPVGTPMDVNYCYGQNPATLREKYREAHDLILKAWREREPFAWNGKYTKLRYVNVWPQPIQKPHPPIWVPGLSSIETWDFCAEHGYNYSYLSYSGYKRAQKMLDGYWERLAARGREANPYSCAFFQQVCLSDSDAACEREWWPHVDYFFNKCLHLYPAMASAPGYQSEASIRAGVVAQAGNTKMNFGIDKSWKELVEQRYIVAGSPATVREQLEELAHSLRCGHLLLGLHIGSAPAELTNRSTYLFATEVMPHLRPIWGEYEDRWWPQALPASERAPAGSYNAAAQARAERPKEDRR